MSIMDGPFDQTIEPPVPTVLYRVTSGLFWRAVAHSVARQAGMPRSCFDLHVAKMKERRECVRGNVPCTGLNQGCPVNNRCEDWFLPPDLEA